MVYWYTYCLNNPLIYTDPSGYKFDPVDPPGWSEIHVWLYNFWQGIVNSSGDGPSGSGGNSTTPDLFGYYYTSNTGIPYSSSGFEGGHSGSGGASPSGTSISNSALADQPKKIVNSAGYNALYRATNFINEFNPIANLWDVVTYAFTGKDRFGNNLTLGQGTLKALAILPVGKLGVIVDNSPSVMGHIFRVADGHINPISIFSKNRYLKLFENVANKSSNLRIDAVSVGLIPQQAADAGVQVFTQTYNNGQVWVFVKNGIIHDAGINLIPR